MLAAFRNPHTGVDIWWRTLKSVCKILHLILTDCFFLSYFLSSCLSVQQNMFTFCCTLIVAHSCARYLYTYIRTFFMPALASTTHVCMHACAGFHHTCMHASWMRAKTSYILTCYIHVHFDHRSLIRLVGGYPHIWIFWAEWMCAVRRGLTVPQ